MTPQDLAADLRSIFIDEKVTSVRAREWAEVIQTLVVENERFRAALAERDAEIDKWKAKEADWAAAYQSAYQEATISIVRAFQLDAALQERDAEIERLKGPVPEDTISNQRTIQENPRSAIGIMQRQNKKIEAQRKVLEQALGALADQDTDSQTRRHRRTEAITAIQEVLS